MINTRILSSLLFIWPKTWPVNLNVSTMEAPLSPLNVKCFVNIKKVFVSVNKECLPRLSQRNKNARIYKSKKPNDLI